METQLSIFRESFSLLKIEFTSTFQYKLNDFSIVKIFTPPDEIH